MFAPGTVLDQRYELLEVVGDGGMGRVFKAKEIQLERTVAIKIIQSQIGTNVLAAARFRREGKLLSTLTHPNVVRIYRCAFTNDNQPFIVMEFIDGVSLRKLLADKERLAADMVINIGIQICQALAFAHGKGVLHRDLKPDNIMLQKKQNNVDVVKLIDFGLAKMAGSTDDAETNSGMVVGSFHYMSPEQCLGHKADNRSDIYSLGCLLYECMSGVPPFTGQAPLAILKQHVEDSPLRLSQYRKKEEIPSGLEEIIFKCLAKAPSDRFQNMGDLAASLNCLAEGQSPAEFLEQNFFAATAASKPSSRNLMLMITAAIGIVCMIGSAAIAHLRSERSASVVTSIKTAALPPLKLALYDAEDEQFKRLSEEARTAYYEAWFRRYGAAAPDESLARYYEALANQIDSSDSRHLELLTKAAQYWFKIVEDACKNPDSCDRKLLNIAAARAADDYTQLDQFKLVEQVYRHRLKVWSEMPTGIPYAEALADLALQVSLMQRPDEARKLAEQAVSVSPTEVPAVQLTRAAMVNLKCGIVFVHDKQTDRARKLISLGVQQLTSEDNKEPLLEYAYRLTALSDAGALGEMVEPVFDAQKSQQIQFAVNKLVADTLFRRNNTTAAEKYYRKAISNSQQIKAPATTAYCLERIYSCRFKAHDVRQCAAIAEQSYELCRAHNFETNSVAHFGAILNLWQTQIDENAEYLPCGFDRQLFSALRSLNASRLASLSVAPLIRTCMKLSDSTEKKQLIDLLLHSAEHVMPNDSPAELLHIVLAEADRVARNGQDKYAAELASKCITLADRSIVLKQMPSAKASIEVAAGVVYRTIGRFAEAENLYLRAVPSIDEDLKASVLLELSYVAMAQGNYQQCAKFLNDHIAARKMHLRAPKNSSSVLVDLCEGLLKHNCIDEALQASEFALQLSNELKPNEVRIANSVNVEARRRKLLAR